ncbi:MAG: gliding motility-associated C-terminal domain-containing protein [Flavobacteriales bacterium]|nr:gliding motility-associated C-terminal domain-containing protein [Flavobacteriales bacterium]
MDPEITFTDQSSSDVTIYDWEFGANGILGTATTNNPVVMFPDAAPGTYPVLLTVTNGNGCLDSIAYTVIIDGIFAFYAPNAFTPNNDGINDLFYVTGESVDDTEFEFFIFDRWGEVIYSSDTYSAPWDGNVKGTGFNAPPAVYAWRVLTRDTITGERKEYKGHVTLLR